jgi:hypothetical protein
LKLKIENREFIMGLTGLSGLSGLSSQMGGGKWWLSGGVSAANCFGAYQGRHAGSYAASKVNLNQPGTNDLEDTTTPSLPDWSNALGWQGGAPNQFFRLVGCRPTEVWSMLVQFKNAQTFSQQFCGAENNGLFNGAGFSLSNTGSFQQVDCFNASDAIGGVQVDGNEALAGKRFFRDGVLTATLAAGVGTAAVDVYLLCDNWNGTAHGGAHVTEVIAFAIYSVTLTDAQMAAIAAAMAAL